MNSYPVVAIGIIFGSGLLFIVSAILMQEVRSKLVTALIAQKSSLSMEISDWSVSGGRLPGNYSAINKEFIWGKRAQELLKWQGTRTLLRLSRVLYVVREIARCMGMVGLTMFLWAFVKQA